MKKYFKIYLRNVKVDHFFIKFVDSGVLEHHSKKKKKPESQAFTYLRLDIKKEAKDVSGGK